MSALENLIFPTDNPHLYEEGARRFSEREGKIKVVFISDVANDELSTMDSASYSRFSNPRPLREDLERAENLLVKILEYLANRHSEEEKELSTKEAADILNVSRPHFVNRILKSGALRYHKVGTHHRVKYRDLMEYKNRISEQRHRSLDRMVALNQKLGAYD